MTTARADGLRAQLIRNHETTPMTPFVRGDVIVIPAGCSSIARPSRWTAGTASRAPE